MLGDGIVDSFGKGCKESEVYTAGDTRAVSEVEGGEAGEDLFDGAVGRQQFRLDRHGDLSTNQPAETSMALGER